VNLLNKYRSIFFWAVLGGIIFSGSYAYSQQIISERPIIYEKGVIKSDAVTVNFKEKVLDLPQGQRRSAISDINPRFQEVIQYLNDLSNRYGEITLYKQIPTAKWGDVWRRNRRTGELVKIHERSQLFSVRFPQLVPIDSVIYELEQLAAVEYAHQPVQVMVLSDPPDDPYYNSSDQWNLFKIDAEKAWDITHGNSNVVVGLVDPGGFNPSHLDLRNKFVPDRGDTVGSGLASTHGTEVAGVIGAETDNGNGIASLGWNIKMIPYAWAEGDTSELVAHIDSARNYPVDVINCSFLLIKDSQPADADDYPSVRNEILDAIDEGIVVVAGTGNEPETQWPDPFVPYPANYTGVIGVAATDINDAHLAGYNYQQIDEDFIDVAAPGDDIKTTYDLPNNYTTKDGTPLAAPHVSALAGLILSLNSNFTPSEVEHIVEETAKDLGNWSYFGHGRINAYQALLKAISYCEYDISGSVSYYNEARPVNDATLVLMHQNGKSLDTTDTNGNYIFTDIAGGDVELTPSKQDDIQDAITGSDALLLLQYLAYLAILTEDQQFAADVTEDGNVTGSDAQALLAYLAFSPNSASTGEWRFDPPDSSFLLLENTVVNFKAFLLGDVTGDWAQPSSKSDSSSTLAELELDFMAPITREDGFIEVPLKVTNVKEPLYTFLLSICYDEKYLTYQVTNKTNLSDKFELVANGTDSAVVHIAMAGITGIEKDGDILRLVFKGNRANISEKEMALDFTRAIINDYDILNDNSGSIGLPKQPAVAEGTHLPACFALYQNYPNPFNPATTIGYDLPSDRGNYLVTLNIYNELGVLVKSLVRQNQAPGSYRVDWDGRDHNGNRMATGLYFYTIQAGDFRLTKKMVLMR